MAITTMDQIVSGLQPKVYIAKSGLANESAAVLHTTLYMTGTPIAATPYAGGINGAALTSYTGSVPIPQTVAGENIYLASMDYAGIGQFPSITLVDRLWHNNISAVTTTTAQTITFPGLPSRDQAGGTNGSGVLAALEVSVATTNASPITNTTISYTNDAGVSGRTGTIGTANPFPATALAGSFVPFALQAGDYGIRSIESVTLGTSYVTGTIHLVLYRELASIGAANSQRGYAGPIELCLPRIYDNSVIQIVTAPSGTFINAHQINLVFAQG